jgi:2-oxoglutarate ferredoxin oxidoreductase subunit gamma
MTLIVLNNNNFAMTGSQVSPTTPYLGNTTTTPFGNVETPLDICEIAQAAGATFVARTTAFHYQQMVKAIEHGIAHVGFSVIECLSPCPTGYGRRNDFRDAFGMYDYLKDNAVPVEKAGVLSGEELENRIVTGVLHERMAPEYIAEYGKLITKAKERRKEVESIEEVTASPVGSNRIEIRLTGSGGQGLVLAGIMLAEAGIRQGNTCVQTQSYGPEARGGASRSEVVFSDGAISFPEVLEPDILLAMTQQSCDKYLSGVKANAMVLLDTTFIEKIPETTAKVYKFPITEYARTEFGVSMVANVLAISMLSEITGLVRHEVIEKTVASRVPPKAREANLLAVKKSKELVAGLLSVGKQS